MINVFFSIKTKTNSNQNIFRDIWVTGDGVITILIKIKVSRVHTARLIKTDVHKSAICRFIQGSQTC